jgi:HAD superfamily hydrolase (TIGR01549 family)
MLTTFLFDFNNVLLFVEESAIKHVAKSYIKIHVPSSFSTYFYLNTELLEFTKEHRQKYQMSILSASEYSLYQPEIKSVIEPYFDSFFFAKDLGWSKDEPATYLATAEKLKRNPQTILFIDDKWENVEAAQRAGMQTIHFTTNSDLIRQIEPLLTATS